MVMPPNEGGPPPNPGPNEPEGRGLQWQSGGQSPGEPQDWNPAQPPGPAHPQPDPQPHWGQQGYPPPGPQQVGEPSIQYVPSGAIGAGGQQMGLLRPSRPDRPSPVGLSLAGVGLLLLAIASLLPQISWDGNKDDIDLAVAGIPEAGLDLPALAPALVLVVLVGLTAVGVTPGLQWAMRLGGIGLAAITAAAAFRPVMAVNAIMEASNAYLEDAVDDIGRIEAEAEAGVGIWLFILAALILAVSIFMMHWIPAPKPMQPQYQQPGPYIQPQQ